MKTILYAILTFAIFVGEIILLKFNADVMWLGIGGLALLLSYCKLTDTAKKDPEFKDMI